MKNVFFFCLLFNICVCGQISWNEVKGIQSTSPLSHISENNTYMPLNIGNLYQFIEEIGTSYSSYRLVNREVLRDTSINNNTYHLYSGVIGSSSFNTWLRYSDQDKKLYAWSNETDLVYMDFNKAPGDTFIQLYYPAIVLSGNTNLFSSNYLYKGYQISLGMPYGNRRELFADGLGIYQYSYSINLGWNSQSLIMAILYDSSGNAYYFSDHYIPQINVNPITVINTRNFNLNFTVTHQHNKYRPPGTPGSAINFINSVKLESYYSKEDSLIIQPTINVFTSSFPNYSVTTYIDTNLMKSGFDYNYRIVAVDKGIIPETSYSPDTGYYNCIWNGPTGIDDNNQYPQTFSLSQNYPNPFNPSTKISWQSPVGSHQTLKVYDVLGREVATLVDEYKDAGSYEVEFQSTVGNRQLASGVYYYQLKVGEFVETMKMILMK